MPDCAQFGIQNLADLSRESRYLVNKRAQSHDRKVKINGFQSWNQAPTRRYAEWVENLQKRWKKKPRRGRPVSWGTWYIFTFPDWTELTRPEKRLYAQALINNLEIGASGISVWHDKFKTGSHDFNMLVSPFALHGGLLLPRRDSQSSEYRRLQYASDRAVEELNRKRAINKVRPIQTMAEVQDRERRANQRKTLAEVLAESAALVAMLTDEDSKKPHRSEEYRKRLSKALTEADHKVESWDPDTWEAAILRPGLPEPQIFPMRHIVGEALALIRARSKSLQQSVEQSATTDLLCAVKAAPSNEPSFTEADVLAVLTRRPDRRRPFVDETDLVRELKDGGLAVRPDRTPGSIQRFLIKNRKGNALTVHQRDLLLAAQCHLLMLRLYLGTMSTLESDFHRDIKALASESPPATEDDQNRYRISPDGTFWQEAFRELGDPHLAEVWKSALEASAPVSPITARIEEIRRVLRKNHVPEWNVFILLVAHCSEAPGIISNHLMPAFQDTPEFEDKLEFLLRMGSKGLTLSQTPHPPPRTR